MKAYSQDLREKAMRAVALGQQSNREIAATIGLSESTLEKWSRRLRKTGSFAAAPHAGGPDRVLAAHGAFLRAAVKAQPDITLAELSQKVSSELKLKVNGSMVSRELARLRLPLKKSRSTTASGKRRG
jgi:transposase